MTLIDVDALALQCALLSTSDHKVEWALNTVHGTLDPLRSTASSLNSDFRWHDVDVHRMVTGTGGVDQRPLRNSVRRSYV